MNAIAIVDSKYGIAKDGKQSISFSEDFRRFKRLTMGRPIIMGHKTMLAIGKRLPGRWNIVVTDNRPGGNSDIPPGVDVMTYNDICSLPKGVLEEAFIIGGRSVYMWFLEEGKIDDFFITHVDYDAHSDLTIPNISTLNQFMEDEFCRKVEEVDLKDMQIAGPMKGLLLSHTIGM